MKVIFLEFLIKLFLVSSVFSFYLFFLCVAMFPIDGTHTNLFNFFVTALTNYIHRIIKSAMFVEHIGSEVSYILPDRENTASLVQLCDSLDKDKTSLGILSYGISDTSLEEVCKRNLY